MRTTSAESKVGLLGVNNCMVARETGTLSSVCTQILQKVLTELGSYERGKKSKDERRAVNRCLIWNWKHYPS